MADEVKDTRKDSKFPAWHQRNLEPVEDKPKEPKKPK